MRGFRVGSLSAVAVVTLVAAAPPGKVVTVIGLDDIAVDRRNIQTALDAAGKNHTIRLVGTFQLDGVEMILSKGHLTIEGQRIDNDGDGKSNEDWPDGQDNDFDGSVDEDGWDTVLRGLTHPDGTPDEGPGLTSFFNRGLAVTLVHGEAKQITIRDIEFSGLVRGVALSPDVQLQPGFFCHEARVTGGSVHNGVIERNRFVDVTRGAQIFGSSHNVLIADNVVQHVRQDSAGGGGQGILVVGGAFNCLEPDGSPRPDGFPIGIPLGTQVLRNVVIGAAGYAIGAITDERTRILDNEIHSPGGFHNILFWDSSKILVMHNAVVGPGCCDGSGVSGFGTNRGAQVKNNTLFGLWTGVYLDGSGVDASNNTAVTVDLTYWLGPSSSDNTVALKAGQTCEDQGAGNKIKGGAC